MLDFMRRQAGSWMIKFLLLAIALAFGLSWGAYNYGNQTQDIAVTVNEQPIPEYEVRREQTNLTNRLREQLGPQAEKLGLFGDMRNQALDRLITETVKLQTASKMGLQATPEEVSRVISHDPAFLSNGVFDKRRYQLVTSRMRMSMGEYEAYIAEQLMKQKLDTLVLGSGALTPLELDQMVDYELSKFKAGFLVFMDKAYKDKVKADNAELTEYYENNKKNYLVPDKFELSYISFNWSDFADQADVLDEDIVEIYEVERDRYATPEQMRLFNIWLKLPEKAGQAEIDALKKKAEQIKKEAEKPGADFAALAKKYSDGPLADKGGDAGFVQHGQLMPDLDKLLFSLKTGEVGSIVNQAGAFVFKAGEKKEASVTPLENVRGEIRQRLVERQARELAQVEAENAFDLAAGGATTAELGKTLKRTFTDLPTIQLSDPIKELPGLKGLSDAVADLANGDVLPVLSYDNGSVLMVLKKRIPESVKPFEQVKAEVTQAVLDKKAQDAAKDAATAFLAELRKASDPKKMLLDNKEAKQTDWLGPQDVVKGLDLSRDLVSALALRPASAPQIKEPVRVSLGYAAAMVLDWKKPAPEELAKKREEYKALLTSAMRREMLQRFQLDLKNQAELKYPSRKPAGT